MCDTSPLEDESRLCNLLVILYGEAALGSELDIVITLYKQERAEPNNNEQKAEITITNKMRVFRGIKIRPLVNFTRAVQF